MPDSDVLSASVSTLQRMLSARTISSEELVNTYLGQIEAEMRR
jgi:Asp-tRNA(Asn)/Glu-tRNA(Gln) amidotransferase A subunit family amidase